GKPLEQDPHRGAVGHHLPRLALQAEKAGHGIAPGHTGSGRVKCGRPNRQKRPPADGELPGEPAPGIARRYATCSNAGKGQCKVAQMVRSSSASATLIRWSWLIVAVTDSTSTCLAKGSSASSGAHTASSASTPAAGGAYGRWSCGRILCKPAR